MSIKKRIIALAAAVMVMFSVTSCGSENKGGTVAEDMSNTNMMRMEYVSDDGWVYGAGYTDDKKSEIAFVASKLDGSQKKVISDMAIPMFVSEHEGKLYAIMQTEKGSNLYSFDTDGGNAEKILPMDITSYTIQGDKIYYQPYDFATGISFGYEKCDLDGSNRETVLMREIYYPYLAGDKLYYQDDNKEEAWFVYDLETEKTEKITDSYCYNFVADGEYGYYIKAESSYFEGSNSGELMKINLETGESEAIAENVYVGMLQVADSRIYYTSGESGQICSADKKDGGSEKTVIESKSAGSLYIYGDNMVYMTYDDVGYLDEVYTCRADGKDNTKL